MTTITALPTPPSRDDPSNFSARADDFLGALPTFATETNTVATEVVVNKNTSVTAANTATTQAGIATTKAGEALSSANAATTQAGIATTKAGEALSSANAAAASYDSFDDRYLGPKSSNPTLDNDGNALLTGALYWNTVTSDMRVYTGSIWVTASTVGGTVLSLSVTGATTLGQNPTLSGGTANGVAYLNGSKVLTTSSALTFDGTNLGVGTSNPSGYGATIVSQRTTDGLVFTGVRFDGTNNPRLEVGMDSSGSYLNATSSAGGNFSQLRFQISSSEQMRLTFTGLGIGTSSVDGKLVVYGTAGSNPYSHFKDASGADFFIQSVGNSDCRTGTASNHPWLFFTNGTEKMHLNAAGNLGLGVTPSAWGNGRVALQLKSNGALYSGNNLVALSSNAYDDGSFRYMSTNAASLYENRLGQHAWFTAPSGTAGNAISFTQAMTLFPSGGFAIGATGDPGAGNFVLDGNGGRFTFLSGSTTNQILSTSAGFGAYNILTLNGSQHVFQTSNTERARIDSSGNLLVGTTTSDGYRFKTEGQYAFMSKMTGAATSSYSVFWHTAATGDNQFIYFSTETASITRGSITYNRSAGLVSYNVTSDYRAKDISGPVVDSGALIDSVPVYMGKMKGATQERPMFIAHEVPAYAHTGEKDAVDADGNPVYQQMDASALVPVMWAEIQSLRKRLAALETK